MLIAAESIEMTFAHRKVETNDRKNRERRTKRGEKLINDGQID